MRSGAMRPAKRTEALRPPKVSGLCTPAAERHSRVLLRTRALIDIEAHKFVKGGYKWLTNPMAAERKSMIEAVKPNRIEQSWPRATANFFRHRLAFYRPMKAALVTILQGVVASTLLTSL